MNKTLTNELIEQKLKEKYNYPEDPDQDVMLEILQDEYDFELTDSYNRAPDYSIFVESTADGYEVWIATDDDRHPSINQDVYYYESDWLEKMEDAMTDGLTIYFQELNNDNYEFEDIVLNVYEEYYNDKRQELIDKLVDDGYEWEEE